MNVMPCPTCEGARLKKESLFVRVGGKNIREVTALSIAEAEAFFADLEFSAKEAEIARRILKEIRERLSFLTHVGLDYLTLDRTAGTLSGGEGQRIRLATQVGSSLVGVLYILDEPSIGLHQRDNRPAARHPASGCATWATPCWWWSTTRRPSSTPTTSSTWGPAPGCTAARSSPRGRRSRSWPTPASLTGRYLSGALAIAVPEQRRSSERFLTIAGARENNLKESDGARSPWG